MSEIDDIYSNIKKPITKEDFMNLVSEKVEQMGGLCDEKTAAMLVAHDLGSHENIKSNQIKIADITADSGNVNFIAKIMTIFPIKEFTRGDGTTGRVANVLVGDETGNIRITLWDDKTDLINEEFIEIGQNLQINGYAKDGYSGPEVNIGNHSALSLTEEDVKIKLISNKISDIKDNMSNLNIIGQLLDKSEIREFTKKDGNAGRVGNIIIGDDSGKIRVTLWDEKNDSILDLNIGDTIEIINGYSRENNFTQQIELQVGTHGVIRKTELSVEYKEIITPIEKIVAGESYSIQGFVSGLGDIREFSKEDGTVNMVSNIYVSDDTGRIRISLWADHALIVEGLDIETPIRIIDAYAKAGFNEDVELSAGNRTKITINPE